MCSAPSFLWQPLRFRGPMRLGQFRYGVEASLPGLAAHDNDAAPPLPGG